MKRNHPVLTNIRWSFALLTVAVACIVGCEPPEPELSPEVQVVEVQLEPPADLETVREHLRETCLVALEVVATSYLGDSYIMDIDSDGTGARERIDYGKEENVLLAGVIREGLLTGVIDIDEAIELGDGNSYGRDDIAYILVLWLEIPDSREYVPAVVKDILTDHMASQRGATVVLAAMRAVVRADAVEYLDLIETWEDTPGPLGRTATWARKELTHYGRRKLE
jgi:hypothetical protein